MRRVAVVLPPSCEAQVHQVVRYDDIAQHWTPDLRFMALVLSPEEKNRVEALRRSGLSNVVWVESSDLEPGDVVVPRLDKSEVTVLLRASDQHHALFMTNRCNSYCLMCSQPPTPGDDSWLIQEALDAVQHLSWTPDTLGLTGGEPLLLGAGLRNVLDVVGQRFPGTCVEVLTNGRLFSHRRIANQILDGLTTRVRWLVPLYGHANFVHDFVVQAQGAFDETLAGLLALQEHRQEIQLRTVLIEPVLQVLPELAGFVGRNLPFVRQFALMGCEPIGFALANRDQCEVNLADWDATLHQASRVLNRHAIPHLFMNTPLCALRPTLWPLAHRSISDWKNTFAAECSTCAVRMDCTGLFAWHEKGWKPAPLKSIPSSEALA